MAHASYLAEEKQNADKNQNLQREKRENPNLREERRENRAHIRKNVRKKCNKHILYTILLCQQTQLCWNVLIVNNCVKL